jgi:SAM-dependent methyltransferase
LAEFTLNRDATVYYGSNRYWNDLLEVVRYRNRQVTGDPDLPWQEYFSRQGRTFDKALFLNCGNGWVEREFLERGIVKEGVGIDISPELLDEARAGAAAAGMPLRYYERDVNTADFPEDGYDLVVNFAACHHTAYLDRVLRRAAELLPADGMLVAEDYIGPHRNQYPYDQWQAAHDLNRKLPVRFRQDLQYPHLPTMLVVDPTEAIHSELILEFTRRYFHLDVCRPLGGALAYLLLTFNDGIHSASESDRGAVVKRIVEADEAYTAANPGSTMFAVFWGRPNKEVLGDTGRLTRWQADEQVRESAAAGRGGHYYPLTVLQELTQENADLKAAVEQARAGSGDPRSGVVQRLATRASGRLRAGRGGLRRVAP